MKYLLVAVLISLPTVTLAQNGSLQGLITGTLGFINVVLIPFILGIAFLIFLINAVRFFIIDGSNTEGHENARNLALYGVGAFVLILSLWGMVNILANGIGLNEGPCIDGKAVQSDYLNSINRTAPCSSIRPRQRPPQPTAPAIVTPNPVPSSATGTTSPRAPIGNGTSFTPDGNPLLYVPISKAQETIRTMATDYLDNALVSTYGANAAVVEQQLFADLGTGPSKNISELSRLQAAYRLRLAGAISEQNLNSYYDAVSAYQKIVTTPTADTITRNAVTNTKLPMPAAVTKNIDTNKVAITKAIMDSNATFDMSNPINTQKVITELFDSSRTIEARLVSFEALRNHPNNPLPGNAIRDAFYDNYNTENAYNGIFKPKY